MTTLSLVTGGSRGLGRNTAISIARHGGDVILSYQSGKDNADAVVAEIEALGRKAVAVQLDTGSISTFPSFVERLRGALTETFGRGTIDHLVNNAGHGEMADFAATTEDQFDKLFVVHVKGVFFLTQALLPVLIGDPVEFWGLHASSRLASRKVRAFLDMFAEALSIE